MPTRLAFAAALATVLAPAATLAAQTAPGSAPDTVTRRVYVEQRRTPGEHIPLAIANARVVGVAPRSAIGVYLGRADTLGVPIDRVVPDGPAAKAGLVTGERIVRLNGTALRVDTGDMDDDLLAAVPARRVERTVGRLTPGSEVELRVRAKDGRERTVRVRTVAPTTLGASGFGSPMQIDRREIRGGPGGQDDVLIPVPGAGGFAFRGQMMSDSLRDSLMRRGRAMADSGRARAERRPALGMAVGATGSPRDTLGLFVSSVVTGGPAERAGVVEGDRIASVNGVDVRVPRDERDDPAAAGARATRFVREVGRLTPGGQVALGVWGGGRLRTVTATLGRAADVYRDQPGGAMRFGMAGEMLPPMPPMPGGGPESRLMFHRLEQPGALPGLPPMGSEGPAAPLAPMPPVGPGAPRVRLRVRRATPV